MTGFKLFLTLWWAANAIVAILSIDKERKPITSGSAAFITVVMGVFIAWAWAVLP